ncbi:glycosyltransferase [Hippea sp. KM1]|uniref:glycosyltransferase n=1 Tax=Hippea sp. KM1 TaxID=944481 RepID=UPI00046D06FF|nr:glycosyltransferase [Hippea sp. KM1]
MRIAFILDEVWDSALTNYALNIEHLAREFHDTVVLSLKDSYVYKSLKNVVPIKPLRNKNPLSSLGGFFYLSKVLKQINPDVVLTIRGDASFFACLLKKSLNFRLFRVFGEDKQLRTPPNCIDTLILPCEFLKEDIPPKRAEKVIIHKSFVDRERFAFSLDGRRRVRRELGIDDKFVFGAVGRLDRVKGFDLLIEGFALAGIDDAVLVIVGQEKGLKKNELLGLAEELNVGDRLILIDQRRSDIVDIMSSFDVGVVSSVGSEVIPRVFFEFMSVGLPIITTDVGCLGEVAKEGFSILAEPTTYSIKKAIQRARDADLVRLSSASLKEAEKYALRLPANFFSP